MMNRVVLLITSAACGLTLLLATGQSLANEWSGYISGEYRGFANGPVDNRQHDNNLSFSAQPEFYTDWDDGQQSFTFVPFYRWDENDNERSHADIRELTWLKAADDWEIRAGLRKVFWGVTESQHLVDVINQTDLVEATDGEEKLGQPMINLALIRDWGTLDLFVLPGFRERTFPGEKGRLRFPLPIDTDQARYESSDKGAHIDYAARWAHALGDWDLGLSYFNGTSRDPSFVAGLNRKGQPVFIPVYNLIEQWGLDLQATLDDWLWKFETISRSYSDSGFGEDYIAVTAGFEYSFIGIADTSLDLGVISEILYDDRGNAALTPFADDIMIGARLTLNDEQSTDFLIGMIIDKDDSTRLITLETSRRIGENWRVSLEGQAFINVPSTDLLAGIRNDDYLQLELSRYF
ncbi:MAG: hypothetical protein COB30_004975 [Ectothiorhodospiraceae bacterium]|nr:hypothetical protein [Ectothiorhodospiraceae bacterium]